MANSSLCSSNALYKSVKRAIRNFNVALLRSLLLRRFYKLVIWDFKKVRFYNKLEFIRNLTLSVIFVSCEIEVRSHDSR